MAIDASALEPKIIARGKEFFQSIAGEAPSIFNKGWWTGKVMDWAMQNEDFKVQMFRFVDVLPYLTTSESLSRHIEEYFGDKDANIPDVLKWGAGKTGFGGGLVAMVLNKAIRSNIEGMARQFIIGEKASEAVKGIRQLRKDGFGFIIDLLGEAPLNEKECDEYYDGYMEILNAIQAECKSGTRWTPPAIWTGAPRPRSTWPSNLRPSSPRPSPSTLRARWRASTAAWSPSTARSRKWAASCASTWSS
jgi:L-proline dehydrogenase (EC 1.5.99.8)/delta-1-pyrroline-5-carboxylate dehydrogenase (EC 1.5.1.12)